MRYYEICRRLTEDDELDLGSTPGSDIDYSSYVEDDADNHCGDILALVLRNVMFSSDHAEIPKIRLDALVNLVRAEPGGEAFNAESLKMAQQHNEAVKNLITNVKEDDNGVKYVYLNRKDEYGADDPSDQEQGGASPSMTAPEKTVASMAKRAAGNRG